ncbi:unnamed protein product [Spirodela intermedia]|uniref:Uncharacterized protein n=1 Tax=Spirodela intermedia TaxID=51605 RepID=A0A7I8K0V8_SPIIN|nr:unnamed protein product [Spirodela intermedia]
MGMISRSALLKKSSESTRPILTIIVGAFSLYFFSTCPAHFLSNINMEIIDGIRSSVFDHPSARPASAAQNPRGVELLPLWIVAFTVGYAQRENINMAVKKFWKSFTIMLFHYDGRARKWDQFEWSKHGVHVSVSRQTKWWYAKRFLHPDVVAVRNSSERRRQLRPLHHQAHLVLRHGSVFIPLHLVHPLQPDRPATMWEVYQACSLRLLPPCPPVSSRNASRCMWHMIQIVPINLHLCLRNDLVHGWGLDFVLRRGVEPPHERIGVVDSQWIVHQLVPSLKPNFLDDGYLRWISRGRPENGRAPWEGESFPAQFRARLRAADSAYSAGKRT